MIHQIIILKFLYNYGQFLYFENVETSELHAGLICLQWQQNRPLYFARTKIALFC